MPRTQRQPHVVVVGGGLGGLRLAHLLQTTGAARCTLLEASSRLGGRILTRSRRVARPAPARVVTYECGAAKALPSHRRFIGLVRELGFDASDLVETPRPASPALAGFPDTDGFDLRRELRRLARSMRAAAEEEQDSRLLRELSVAEHMMLRGYGTVETARILAASGYAHVFERCSAAVALRYLERDFLGARTLLTFEPGLESLVRRLRTAFERAGGTTLLRHRVERVRMGTPDRRPHVVVYARANAKERARCDLVVFAAPPGALRRIDGLPEHVLEACDAVEPVPLVRVFAESRDETIGPWTHVGNAIQRTGRRAPGFLQVVYASGERALFWKKMLEHGRFHQALEANLRLPPSSSPRFRRVEPRFFEAGVHLWRPGHDGRRDWERLMRDSVRTGAFVVGEAFSPYQRWMESALQTAEDVAGAIIKKLGHAMGHATGRKTKSKQGPQARR